MPCKRKSEIWKIPSSKLIEIIASSCRYTEVLEKIGIPKNNTAGRYKTLVQRIKEENIDCSHFKKGNAHLKNYSKEISIDNLCENSNTARCTIKRFIIKNNLIEYKCQKCQNDGNWLDKKLTLQLDHINGINNDHRLENLRFLCPNCHSQTTNFSGKSLKKDKKCNFCGINIAIGNRKRCNNCKNKKKCKPRFNKRKVDRPDKETLLSDIKNIGYRGTGRKYGVSDNAIRKWIKTAI